MKLQLSLIKHWYEKTDPNCKTEDYREITPYWKSRFTDQKKNWNRPIERWKIKEFTYNIMTLGYPKSTDTSRIKIFEHAGIEIGYGKEEWGAEPNKLYFIIKHGKRIQ